jgi:hypothetical protein
MEWLRDQRATSSRFFCASKMSRYADIACSGPAIDIAGQRGRNAYDAERVLKSSVPVLVTNFTSSLDAGQCNIQLFSKLDRALLSYK